MTTVGQALVAGLAARGVEVVFGIPGVHTIELYRGLSGSGIRHVTARHEQGAGFMADGYARVSGKPGVAFVITGPGLTNTLTAMAQARADSVPMLVVGSVNPVADQGRNLGLLHELPDQAALVRALCPTRRITDPAALGSALDWAFATLASGRPGPVYLEVPTDVLPMPCPPQPAPAALPPPPAPDAALVAQAVARLAAAKRLVIIAGGGARRGGAALQRLAERLDAPVIPTVNARGVMHAHPLVVPGSISLMATRSLLTGADLVLALGTEIAPTDYDMYHHGAVPELGAMIRVDVSETQLASTPAALAIAADAGLTVEALLSGLGPAPAAPPGAGSVRAAAARAEGRLELAVLNPQMPLQLQMLEILRDAIPGALIVGDSTQPVYAGNLYYDHDRPGGWFNAATGYGALGFAPGAAVGAALAAPGTPVICLIGDGGLQFSPGELRTAVDEGLAITFLVWNNGGFREIAEAMQAAGAEVIGCTPSPLRLEPFAAACDLPFTTIAADPAALAVELAARPAGPNLMEIRAP
jgi:acetolactate synthase-1/2/3 large subunit